MGPPGARVVFIESSRAHMHACTYAHTYTYTTAKLGKRGWRRSALPQMQLTHSNCTASGAAGVIFLLLFFVVVPGPCVPHGVPHLHLSGLRDTVAICLYFSNPSVWTPQCGDYWEHTMHAANFTIFFLYEHPCNTSPRSSHGMKYWHFINSLAKSCA